MDQHNSIIITYCIYTSPVPYHRGVKKKCSQALLGSRDLLFDLMTEHPTTTWQAMQDGNVFYRRQQLYSISGKLPDFADFVAAGCRYGGPIGWRLCIYNSAIGDNSKPLCAIPQRLLLMAGLV